MKNVTRCLILTVSLLASSLSFGQDNVSPANFLPGGFLLGLIGDGSVGENKPMPKPLKVLLTGGAVAGGAVIGRAKVLDYVDSQTKGKGFYRENTRENYQKFTSAFQAKDEVKVSLNAYYEPRIELVVTSQEELVQKLESLNREGKVISYIEHIPNSVLTLEKKLERGLNIIAGLGVATICAAAIDDMTDEKLSKALEKSLGKESSKRLQ